MTRPSTRREFLQSVSLASAAAFTTPALASKAEGLYDGPIVDPHLHLWDLKALRLPWVESLTGPPKTVLGHNVLMADYEAASRGLGIKRTVYMEVDAAEDDEVKEAETVNDVCAGGKTSMVAAVISGRPASPGFARYLDRFRDKPAIKGLRQVLQGPTTPSSYFLSDDFVKGIRLLGERGLSFDVCVRGDQLGDVLKLIERCPGTKFVLDHCGNPHAGAGDFPAWRKALAKIARAHDHGVYCKVSGLYGTVSATDWPADRLAPVVRDVIDRFGWDRVMFAGDWPVVNLGASLKVWVETLKGIVRGDSPENQKKLFHDNATAFYRLKPSAVG